MAVSEIQTRSDGGDRPPEETMTRLSALLVQRGHLSEDTMEELDHRVKWLDASLAEIIRDEGLVPEEVVLELLSEITGIPTLGSLHSGIAAETVDLVPARVATRYRVMPLQAGDGVITLGTDRIHSTKEGDHLRVLLDYTIEWALCKARDISECIHHYYGVGIEAFVGIESSAGKVGQGGGEGATAGGDSGREGMTAFVFNIIEDAVRSGATDIHFEPYEHRMRLRYRIDGALCEMPLPIGVERYGKAIVSSIKVMGKLNIAERRLPQDGRMSFAVEDRSLDIRLSVLPSQHGETVNLRILNREAAFLGMKDLGLRDDQFSAMDYLSSLPNGMVLFTGATGSGKTTSLYAALDRLNKTERKIITIEDPVEYRIEGITQLQANADIGFTFGSGLRSVLRHDPDVVLIGEIRDAETASIATSAALTGHLVFSTLHTNDSASAVMRLIDIGVDPYLVAAGLHGVVAQRLIRLICPSCRNETAVDETVLKETRDAFPGLTDGAGFYEGVGCPECRFTGYKGRKAIFEILVMDDELRKLVIARASSVRIMTLAVGQGLETLRYSGWRCAVDGITSVEEVMRVVSESHRTYSYR